MPGVLLSWYSPEKARSVPPRRQTWNCVSDSSSRQASRGFSSLSMGKILNRKNRRERFLTSRSDGPQGSGHGWHAIKKPNQYLCQGQAATYHSTPVCHPRYNLTLAKVLV